MSAVDIAVARLKVEEGFRSKPYTDTRGYVTLGYGFNTSAGISEYAASALLVAQVQELDRSLHTFVWYGTLNDARQSVCIDIALNEGLYGFVNNWPRLIQALTVEDWEGAQAECHTSTTEDEARYEQLGQILLTGNA
jgi:GH24 family phage-related lysozyme (muramidase)